MTDIFPLSPPERFFCCALADDAAWRRQELKSLWEASGEDAVWDFAFRNRAESVVALALRDCLGPHFSGRWAAALGSTEQRLRLYMQALDRVAAALAEAGIPLVALKNSGIARGIFPELAGCPMGDVDVLVDPKHFRSAHAILLELGYRLDSRSPLEAGDFDEVERHGGTEYIYLLPDKTTLWLELQWRPVAGRWIRPDQEPTAGELIARSAPIQGTAVRLLAVEDNLLQVCLHTAKHSFIRAPGFRLHTDVDRIVRRCPINWHAFVSRVKSLQVCTAVYLSLRIPAELLKTPVPGWVLNALCPGQRKAAFMLRWLVRAGLFDPDRRKWSKGGYIAFNLMLYDGWRGIWRGAFPAASWMQQRYEIKRRWTLPWWYGRRIVDLVFRRANT